MNNSQQVVLDQRDTWMPGQDMSLKLSKLKKSHEGLYSCEIWKGWHRARVANVTLKVKGKIHLYIYTFLISQAKNKHPSSVFGHGLLQTAELKEW